VPDREQGKVDQTLHRNAIYQMAQSTDMPVSRPSSTAAFRISAICCVRSSRKFAVSSPTRIAASIRARLSKPSRPQYRRRVHCRTRAMSPTPRLRSRRS
jgi:hypothetical protein